MHGFLIGAVATGAHLSARTKRGRRMAWTAEDRRKYAPVIQEMVRQGMLVRLARTTPWCTDQRDGRTDPHPRPGSRDADGLRAPELQHPVQGTSSDGDLGRLTAVRARSQRAPDQGCRHRCRNGPTPGRPAGRLSPRVMAWT